MPLSTAQRNRRKRERKKREKEAARKEAEQNSTKLKPENETEIEIEYVAEPISFPTSETTQNEAEESGNGNVAGLPPGVGNSNETNQDETENEESIDQVLRRFQERAALISDDDAAAAPSSQPEGGHPAGGASDDSDEDDDSDDDDRKPMSKRKLRDLTRPSVAELKRRVARPDLVEAHDISAPDPDFLIQLKSVSGTVPVPRHWGRKRKYLQGKRGYEKKPFALPDFLVQTGITELRDTLAQEEAGQSAKQKNRSRVAPKLGAMDVDYKTLHDAFFKHQTKPNTLTVFGDLYYEGKELETNLDQLQPGSPLSQALRDALGMVADTAPPPWLLNMQRYGPPPSYPNLKIPGLNAPLPSPDCHYGYHAGGWGKPPLDAYGRPVYGGNPFDPPGSRAQSSSDADATTSYVTSDGKTLLAKNELWGSLPTAEFLGTGDDDDDASSSSSEEESSSSDDDAMQESDDDNNEGIDSVLPPPPTSQAVPGDLRKPGDETPMTTTAAAPPKQLYQVLQEQQSSAGSGGGAVFASEVQYVVPGAPNSSAAAAVDNGAASTLSKAVSAKDTSKTLKKKNNEDDDEDDEGLGQNFKF